MKIIATCSGGFAGLAQHFTIDTAKHRCAKTHALEQAVARLGFFDAAAEQTPDAIGADMLRWQITVDDNGHEHSIGFVQNGSREAAQWDELLERIRAAAA